MNFFSKREESESGSVDRTTERLRGLEVKVNVLITLVLIQICVSLYLAIQTLFPSWTTIIVLLILTGSLGWIFRKQLPSWAGLITRKLLRGNSTDSQSKAEKFE